MAVWRGDQLGGPVHDTLTTGFAQLDDVLPGGGWPCGAITEVLVPQFSVSELRLLSKTMALQTGSARPVALIGPPHAPHPPGLRHDRVDERHLLWIDVDTPRDRQWCTEQLVKAGTFGAVVAWIPLVRAEQIRRLQVLAGRCKGPVFLVRPEVAAREASAAPLRVQLRPHTDWQISLRVLKRKGAPLEETLMLPSLPGGLSKIMTERLRYPSRLKPVEPSHAVVRVAAAAVRDGTEVAQTSEH
jgi:protein ImuA